MSRSHCIGLSVDVDRFSDSVLRSRWCPGLLIGGKEPTPEELRAACAAARAKGLEAFPPCDSTDEKGNCQGHPVEGPRDDRPAGDEVGEVEG